MKNIPPEKLTQNEVALLANSFHDKNAVKDKINVPVNFSTFEEQFNKLIKNEENKPS